MKRAWPWGPSPDGRKPSCRGTGQAIDQAWQQGAVAPVHVVSDGDQAIAAGLQTVYGREVPHQLCHFSSTAGVPAQSGLGRLGRSAAAAGVRECGRRATVGAAGGGFDRWTSAVLVSESLACKGLRHLQTGQGRISRPCRGWNGRTGSTGDGKRWARYGRRTTPYQVRGRLY